MSKRSLVIQGVSGKDERVHFIQPLLIDVGDRFKLHEFLFVPNCDCNLLGRDLMARIGMQISIVRSDTESETVISLCKMSEKAYAKINPEVWAAPGKYGKLDIEPLQFEATRTSGV